MRLVLNSENIFNYKKKLKEKFIIIENEKIIKFSNNKPDSKNILKLNELFLIPGLFDIHTHGSNGTDFMRLDRKKIDYVLKKNLNNGVTSITPTLVATSLDNLKKIINFYSDYLVDGKYNSIIQGLHFESPYISKKFAGAQPIKNIHNLTKVETEFWINAAKKFRKNIRLTIAPELENIKNNLTLLIKNGILFSIGHTNCNYTDAVLAFKTGLNSITHIFNAMPGIHHRNPGPIIAALENSAVFIELICDGLHIHQSIINLVSKIFKNRIIIISDSLPAAGLKDGKYKLGENIIYLKEGICRTKSGALAGSTSSIIDSMKLFKNYTNAKLTNLIRYTSYNPSKLLNLKNIGDLKEGYDADIIGIDKNFKVKFVMAKGKIFKKP